MEKKSDIMTDNEIVKALKCCKLTNEQQESQCEDCPLYETSLMICQELLAFHALGLEYLEFIIGGINKHRRRYMETNDKREWYQIIQLLPTSYNQKRTVTLNYEVLLNIYHARRNHKLDEWHILCDAIAEMPYFREICLEVEA